MFNLVDIIIPLFKFFLGISLYIFKYKFIVEQFVPFI